MSGSMLESLPQEILLLVLQNIDQDNAHTIVDFACVCKILYYRLTPFLFRTLRFSAHDVSQLAEDVYQTRQILQRVNGYGYVRRLIIDDKIKTIRSLTKNDLQPECREQAHRTSWYRPRMSSFQYSNHFDDLLANCFEDLDKRGDDIMSLQAVYETNDLWKPLADFVGQIPSLDGLFYDCLHQLPPCLLQCLHQSQPQCRLYINQFRLRSMNAHGTDDYEYSLASSPSLHGLTILDSSSFPGNWYDELALRCIVGGLAPNLRKLHRTTDLGRHKEGLRGPWKPWTGFAQQTVESKERKSRGALEWISSMNWGWLRPFELEQWEILTDFSALTTLKIDYQSITSVSEKLATRCYFPSLESLDIELGHAYDTSRYFPRRINQVESFMLNLPALSTLKMTGWHSRISIDTILERHGPRLRRLSIMSFDGQTLSLENLRQLVETCQVLEALTIQIKRSRGSYEEYICYQTIGLLSELRHLDLRLDTCRSLRHDRRTQQGFEPSCNPSFSEFDEKISSVQITQDCFARNGHVRDAFINGTLDKELAYNIYHAVCSLRYQKGDNHFVPLSSVKVGVTGAFHFQQHPNYITPPWISGVFDYLGRACCVKRIFGSDGNVKIVVEQEPSPEIPKTSLGREILELDQQIDAVYKRVWPSKGPNWWNNWHSFPLAKSIDEEIDWKSR